MESANAVHPVGLIEEIELVQAARRVLLSALRNEFAPTMNQYGSLEPVYSTAQVELAKWVIENIWTPETPED